MMRRAWIPLPVVLLAVGCGSTGVLAPGNDETDRVARVVSDAIGWPRQESAMGYARAAATTTAGRDGRLSVVEVTELAATDSSEPLGELTFLVHLEGSTEGWVKTDPVTACYRVRFGSYGAVGSPRRMRCPDDVAPVEIPPPAPAPPPVEIPEGADRVLRAALRRLPPVPRAGQLEAHLAAAFATERREAAAAAVDVVTAGGDVGVSVRGDGECLLGARTAGTVEVWRPSAVQLQPGELTCDPQTALAAWGQEAPH